MSAAADTPLGPLARAGEAFVQAIEAAGARPLTARQHLDLLDEITDWLIRTHIAHDIVWNDYYARAGERMAERRGSSPISPPRSSADREGGNPDA